MCLPRLSGRCWNVGGLRGFFLSASMVRTTSESSETESLRVAESSAGFFGAQGWTALEGQSGIDAGPWVIAYLTRGSI